MSQQILMKNSNEKFSLILKNKHVLYIHAKVHWRKFKNKINAFLSIVKVCDLEANHL